MPAYDFRSPRLYLDAPLAAGAELPLDRAQAHYLTTVLRLKSGDGVLVFNGRDGEWSAALSRRRSARQRWSSATKPAPRPRRPTCIICSRRSNPRASTTWCRRRSRWAPRGCSRCSPATARWRGSISSACAPNAIEAAEQCGILCLPDIAEPAEFFAPPRPPAIRRARSYSATRTPKSPIRSPRCRRCRAHAPLAVLIGPEGGFAEDERAALLKLPNVVRIALGPRILRADTAAVRGAGQFVQAVGSAIGA